MNLIKSRAVETKQPALKVAQLHRSIRAQLRPLSETLMTAIMAAISAKFESSSERRLSSGNDDVII